jgi:DNA mismatch repair protein MutS
VPAEDVPDLVLRLEPAECLCAIKDRAIVEALLRPAGRSAAITARPDWWFEEGSARSAIDRAVGGARLEGLGFDLPHDLPGIGAAGGIVHYLDENEPTAVSRITTLAAWRRGERMEIDEASRRSLELVRTPGASGNRRSGSLAGAPRRGWSSEQSMRASTPPPRSLPTPPSPTGSGAC